MASSAAQIGVASDVPKVCVVVSRMITFKFAPLADTSGYFEKSAKSKNSSCVGYTYSATSSVVDAAINARCSVAEAATAGFVVCIAWIVVRKVSGYSSLLIFLSRKVIGEAAGRAEKSR